MEKQLSLPEELRINIRKLGNSLGKLLLVLDFTLALPLVIYLFHFIANVDLSNLEEVIGSTVSAMSFTYLIGIAIQLLILYIYGREKMKFSSLSQKSAKMTFRVLVKLIIMMLMIQAISQVFDIVMEYILNIFGYSLSITGGSSEASFSLGMFLYAGFFGPLVEEFIFRGVLLRRLQKYGRLFAIITTSVLFGLYHGNFPQIVFATLMGFLIAYTALEYSLGWAIILHIINNFVIGDILYYALLLISPQHIGLILNVILAIAFVIACAILWRNKMEIKEYINCHRSYDKKRYQYFFTSLWIVIFIVFCLLTAINSIYLV